MQPNIKIPPNILNRGTEREKSAYSEAYKNYTNIGAPDIAVPNLKGGVDIVTPGTVNNEPWITNTYTTDNTTVVDIDDYIQMGTTPGGDTNNMQNLLTKSSASYRRSQEVAASYAKYQSGMLAYEDFLLEAYGRDLMKAQGMHTDSVAWWKSELRKGNSQHPLDNMVIREKFINDAENLFRLESFYQGLMMNDTTKLESLVGKVLDEDGYKMIFGEPWEELVKKLGDWETAANYFKAGQLGDHLNQLVYEQYDEKGQGVGDPVYYLGYNGVLYELIDKGQNINRKYQMYLEKNSDGSVDRVTQAGNGVGEVARSLGNGIVNALTSFADLVAMIGVSVKNAFGSDGNLALLIPFSMVFIQNEAAAKDFMAYQGFMDTKIKNPFLKQQDFDNDKMDHLGTTIGNAVGYVVGTIIEMYLTAGFGKMAKAASAAKVVGSDQIIQNAAKAAGAKITSEMGETITKKLAVESFENIATKELGEELTKSIGKKGLARVKTEFIKNIGKEAGETIGRNAVADAASQAITGALLNQTAKTGLLKATGYGFSRTMELGLKTTSGLKQLNNGIAPALAPLLKNHISKKWLSTVSRASLNFFMTAAETSMMQRGRQLVDDNLSDADVTKNSVIAGLIVAASTLFLSSSTDDYDAVRRFQSEGRDEVVNAVAALHRSGTKTSDITADMINDWISKNKSEVGALTVKTLNDFNIGKFVLKTNLSRVAGAGLEFMDNVITTSARNSAMMGRTPFWGDGKLDLSGAISPDVIISSLLSTGVSYFGRRFPANEGSIDEGAAAAKQDIRNMYARMDGILTKLAEYDPELMILVNKIKSDFITEFKATGSDINSVEPHLRVLDKISKEIGVNNPTDAMYGIEVMVNKVLENQKVKDAINEGVLKPYEIKKFGDKVNFKEMAGMTQKQKVLEKNMNFYRTIVDMYEIKQKHREKIIHDFKETRFGNFFLKGNKLISTLLNLGDYETSSKMDDSNSVNHWRSFLSTAGIDLNDDRLKTENFSETILEALGLQYEKLSESIIETVVGKSFDQKIVSHQTHLFYKDIILKGMQEYATLEELVKIKTDYDGPVADLNSPRDVSKTRTSDILDQKALERERAKKVVADFVESKNSIEAATKDKLGLNEKEIEMIASNSKSDAAFLSHIENGVVINYFGKDMPGDDDPDTVAYKQSVIRALLLIQKLNKKNKDDDSPNDFVILNANEGKVFVASSQEIENPFGVNNTFGKLNKILTAVHVLNSKDVPAENKMQAVDLMTKIIKDPIKTFFTVESLIEDRLTTDVKLETFINMVNTLASGNNPTIDISTVHELIMLRSDRDKLPSGGKDIASRVYHLDKNIGSITSTLIDPSTITKTGMGKLLSSVQYIMDNKKLLTPEYKAFINYDETFVDKLYSRLTEYQKNGNFPETLKELEKFITPLSVEFSERRDLRRWARLTNNKRVNQILDEIVDVENSGAYAVIRMIANSLRSNEEGAKLLEQILDDKDLSDIISYKGDIREAKVIDPDAVIGLLRNNKDEFLGAIYLYFIAQKNKEKMSFVEFEDAFNAAVETAISKRNFLDNESQEKIIKKRNDIETKRTEVNSIQEKLDSKLAEDLKTLGYDASEHEKELKKLNTNLKRATTVLEKMEAEQKKLISETFIEAKEKEYGGIEAEIKDAIANKLFLAIVNKNTFKEVDSDKVEKIIKKYNLASPTDKDNQKTLKKRLTFRLSSNDLADLIPSVESYFKKSKKVYNNMSDIVTDIQKAYEEMKIISTLEDHIIKSYQQVNDIYKNTKPIKSDNMIVTINMGELSSDQIKRAMRGFKTIQDQKDGDLSSSNYEIVVGLNEYRLIKELDERMKLQQSFKQNPIQTFDLNNEADSASFYSIMKVLGYSDERLHEASKGKVHKIDGVYFNNDSQGLIVNKSKYKTMQELIDAETNDLFFETVEIKTTNYLTNKEVILGFFPKGIIGFNENTKLLKGGNFNAIWDYKEDNLVTEVLTRYITSKIKSGKDASINRDVAYGFALKSLGLEPTNPNEFTNYLILKSIGYSFAATLDETKTPPQTKQVFAVPEGKEDKLKLFGWVLDSTKKYIEGFDMNINNEFFQSFKGETVEIEYSDYLPIEKNQVFDNLDGGGDYQNFLKAFYEENELLRNQNDGKIKMMTFEKDASIDFKAADNLTVKQMINKYKDSTNLQERLLAVQLEAALIASKKYDEHLKDFYGEDAERVKAIGQLAVDEDIAKELADPNNSPEVKRKNINKILNDKANSQKYVDGKIEREYFDGVIPANEHIVYGHMDYNQLKNINLSDSDLNLLNKITATNFNIATSETMNHVAVDLKNKFISMLGFDDEKGFYITAANAQKLYAYDFRDDQGNLSLFGGWVDDTFGEDFRFNLEEMVSGYDNLITVGRSSKFQPQEIGQRFYTVNGAVKMKADFLATTDPESAKEFAKGYSHNKQLIDERNALDQETMRLSDLENETQGDFKNLFDNLGKEINRTVLNATNTLGRNQYTNLKNKVSLSNYFESLNAVEKNIENGTLIPGIKIENEEQRMDLAFKIVSLSMIRSEKDMKNSLIFITKEGDNDYSFKILDSTKNYPYETLALEILKNKGNEKDLMLLRIEEDFALKKPNEKNHMLGFTVLRSSNPELYGNSKDGYLDIYRSLFYDYYSKIGTTDELTPQSAAEEIVKILYRDSRINANKNLMIEEFDDMAKNEIIPAKVAEDFGLLFRSVVEEMQSASASNSLTEEAMIINFMESQTILNEKQRNHVMKKIHGIVFDNINPGYLREGGIDALIEKAEEAVLNTMSKSRQDELKPIVDKLVNGNLHGLKKFTDVQDIADILKLFAVYSPNTSFKRLLLETMISDRTLENYKTFRSGKGANDFIVTSSKNKKYSYKELMESNAIVRNYFDTEWAFDSGNKRFAYQIALEVNGEVHEILINPGEELANEINAGKNGAWTKFNTFISNDIRKEKFEKAKTSGLTTEEGAKKIIELLNKGGVFFSYNGKGVDSDIDVIKKTFNNSLLNKALDNMEHIDLLNDVVKLTLLTTESDKIIKNDLQTIGQMVGVDRIQTHTAEDDISYLKEVSTLLSEFFSATEKAKTKVLDHIDVLYKTLSGKDLDESMFQQLAAKMLFNADLTDEELKNLETWDSNRQVITDSLIKKAISRLNYIESIRTAKQLETSLIDDLKKNIYNFDELKQFFIDTKKKGEVIRQGLTKLYNIWSNPTFKNSKTEQNVNTFLSQLTKALGTTYEQKFEPDSTEYIYTDEAFTKFINDLITSPDNTIDRVLTTINGITGGDSFVAAKDYESSISTWVNKVGNVVDEMKKNIKDADQYLIDKARFKVIKKIGLVAQELAFSFSGDETFRRDMWNQFSRLIGATDEYKSFDEAKKSYDRIAQTRIYKGDFVKQLEQSYRQGLKDIITTEALYRFAKPMTPEMIERLHIENDGIGSVVVSKSLGERLLGMTEEKFKAENGVKDIYLSFIRHPSDKFDTIHAYKVIFDYKDGNEDNISMNGFEFFSKHSGDFDGDHVVIYVPDAIQQKVYNDENSKILEKINAPFIKAQQYLNMVLKDEGVQNFLDQSYLEKAKNSLKYQKAIAEVAWVQDDIYIKLMNDFYNKDFKHYDEIVQYIFETITDPEGTYKLKDITIEDVKQNFMIKDEHQNYYYVNNKYLIEKSKLVLNEAQRSALKGSNYGAMFKQSVLLTDQTTGVAQKDLMQILDGTKMPTYSAIKLRGIDFEVIEQFLSTPEGIAATNEFFTVNKENPFILGGKTSDTESLALKVYKKLLYDQIVERESKEFSDSVQKNYTDILNAMKEFGPNSIEKTVDAFKKRYETYRNLLPEDFINSKINLNNRIGDKQKFLLMEMFREYDDVRRSHQNKKQIEDNGFVQTSLSKPVKILIEKGAGEHVKEPNAVKLIKSFKDDTYIYTPHFELQNKDKPEGEVFVKPFKFGRDTITIYRRPIDSQAKIALLDAGTFGKGVISSGTIDDDAFKGYSYIMHQSSLDDLKKTNSPNIEFLDDVVIGDKSYSVVSAKMFLTEDEMNWDSKTKPYSVDELSFIMGANSVESMILMGGAVLKLNTETGEVVVNTDELRDAYSYRQQEKNRGFYEPNFMSLLNQTRGLVLIEYGLKNIKDPNAIKLFERYKEKFRETNMDFSNAGGLVENIFYVVKKYTGENDFQNSLSGIRKKLFTRDLDEMAEEATFGLFDFSPVDSEKNLDRFIFSSKSGNQSHIEKIYNMEKTSANLRAESNDHLMKGKLKTNMYLPSLKAMNYLLGEDNKISKDSLSDLVSHGLINLGAVGTKNLGNLYGGYDLGHFEESVVEPNTLSKNTSSKSGHLIKHGGGQVELNLRDGGFLGEDSIFENNERYFGSNDYARAYDLMKNFFLFDNGKLDTDFLKGREGENSKLSTRGRKMYNGLSILLGEQSPEDKVRSLSESGMNEFISFYNNKSFDIDKSGDLRVMFKQNKGQRSHSIADVFAYIKAHKDQTAYADIHAFKEKRKEELSKGLLTQEMFDMFKAKKETPIDLDEFKGNKLATEIKTSDDMEAVKAKQSGNIVYDTDGRTGLKQFNEGDTKLVHNSLDVLDTVGLKAKTLEGSKVKQGVGIFYRDSKSYLIEGTQPVNMIIKMIGNNAERANDFDRFTKIRLLDLNYKMYAKDAEDLKIINKRLLDFGYHNIEDARDEMRSFVKKDPVLVNLYLKAVANLESAAESIIDVTGGRNNINELFLLNPVIKKDKGNKENKQKYIDTLNTIFLNKKKTSTEMAEGVLQYNFGDSVFEMMSRMSKVRALKDAVVYFKDAGVLENKSVYETTVSEFERQLETLNGTKDTFKKQQIIKALSDVHNNLSNNLTSSETFYKDVYDVLELTVQKIVDNSGLGADYKNKSIFELEQELDGVFDPNTEGFLKNLIDAKKNQVNFMLDTINLNKEFADKVYARVDELARVKDSVLTNELVQMLPDENRSGFKFTSGLELKNIRDNVSYLMSGENDTQRKLYMALTGNLFLANTQLANHLDKYFFTTKVSNRAEKILNDTKANFTKFVMSTPHKLINRLFQYSLSDLALITTTAPGSVKYMASGFSEMRQFFASKGASLENNPRLKLFIETIGFDPFAYSKKSLNLDTFEAENPKNMGEGYFKFIENKFSEQTLLGRYILWQKLYDDFVEFDKTGKDRRSYGPLYHEKAFIDAMEKPEDRAREVMYATIGGPNGFSLIARKELNNIGMFLTYPLSILRTGIGHVKSIGTAFNQIMDQTADKSTARYLASTGIGVIGTQLLVQLIAAVVADHYEVDEETEEEWKKEATYIDPFLTLLNDRPVPLMSSTGLYSQLREMFYEPFEKSKNLLEGGLNWLSSNVISRLNPLFKMPIELISGKEFYATDGPRDNQANGFVDNLARKTLSVFIGASGANAMADQWYYTKLGDEDPNFVNKLGISLSAAVKAEMGNYRGYKTDQKNYFKALNMVRGFRNLEMSKVSFANYDDNGYDANTMFDLSYQIRKALDREQPASVIYGLIDEAIKDGASKATIKSALFNNSISGRLSQIKDLDTFYANLNEKDDELLKEGLKYEEIHYSILKTFLSEYTDSKSNNSNNFYIPQPYFVYPKNNYSSYYRYQNSWFEDDKWKKYANDFIKYRAKNNFVPSLTDFTGKNKKNPMNVRLPYKKKVYGKLNTYKYYNDEEDR